MAQQNAPARVVIYCFSGTGNTLAGARMTARALEKLGTAADVWRVRRPFDFAPDPNNYDAAVFAYPVHAFNTPRFFLSFVKTLPRAEAMPAFILKTSGEPFAVNDASSYPLVRLLRRKGFIPSRDTHMLMPYNIMFRYPDALAKQMYLHTARMAQALAARICAGDTDEPAFNPFTVLWMWVFRIQWLGARLNGPLIHVREDSCTRCGACAQNCPAQNIVMDDLPRFSNRCAMCMNCAFSCPQDAVRPGFLNPWRVNGSYRFDALARNPDIPDDYINDGTRGYFGLFRRYYRATETLLRAPGADCGDAAEGEAVDAAALENIEV